MVASKPEHAKTQQQQHRIGKYNNSATQPQQQHAHQSNNFNPGDIDTHLLPPLIPPPGKELEAIQERSSSSSSSSAAALSHTHLPLLNGETKRQIKLGSGRKRTKHDEELRLQTLERQKANLIETQVVWRKPFVGRAFLADPPELWFRDFDVGQPQHLHFTLTNVSHTFNHFKLLALSDDVRDFFEIQ